MPTFVDESVTVHSGDAAAARLKAKRDAPSLSCSPERWQEAQRYERRTWMELHREMSDDRNLFHAEAMGGYEALRGCGARTAIEVGCGPFTNWRLIRNVVDACNVTLCDPLIVAYMVHPGCAYPRTAPLWSWTVSEARAKAGRFDIVVCINVAEHCDEFDLPWLLDMCNHGGHVVVGERVYDDWRVDEHCREHYDAGHPLRLLRSQWDAFRATVDVVHEATRPGDDGGYSDLRYLIGRKR